MVPLPDRRPKQLSLGPLEAEVLETLYALGSATVKEVRDRLLSDPDRELAYASVTTVLRRLTKKGWLECDKRDRAFRWTPVLSRDEAQMLQSHDRLQRFLDISNPDVVAAFADSLDGDSLDRLEAITERVRAMRQGREADA
ncbi:CopY family transcriptional regulator [Leptolyngbya valderiana BDU 20041]|nr:BlaI/MecI/CopY family transcriptional regulator [Geitlerinema sp. CS-897]OAB57949.1 CopY family transcriptional regulator [Leptolyngbya valderiana BDU 20041]